MNKKQLKAFNKALSSPEAFNAYKQRVALAQQPKRLRRRRTRNRNRGAGRAYPVAAGVRDLGPSMAMATVQVPRLPINSGLVVSRRGGFSLMAMTCGLLDPFCPAANGARFPDGQMSYTIPFRAMWSDTITTGATTVNGLVLFLPDASAYASASSTSATSSFNITTLQGQGLATSFIGTGASSVATIRLVSAGARWCPLSSATTPGALVLISDTSSADSLINKTIAVNDYALSRNTIAVDHRVPFTWTARRADMLANSFVDPIGDGSRSGNWTGMAMQFLGAPASTTLGVFEYVLNLECTLNALDASNNSVQQVGTVAEPENPIVQAAVKAASRLIDAFVTGAQEGATRGVEAVVSNVLRPRRNARIVD